MVLYAQHAFGFFPFLPRKVSGGGMKAFVPDEIRKFLGALDRHAPGPFELTVIGGAAASLAYNALLGTLDIDTDTNVDVLEEACALARKESGLDIPCCSKTQTMAHSALSARCIGSPARVAEAP